MMDKKIYFSRRVICLLFLFNFSLTMLSRYLSTSGTEDGSPDSWDYHLQVNQIVQEGMISWAFNPLSYYGLYPPYMEVGIETLFATFVILSDIHITYSVLILSVTLGILSSFFFFILCRELFHDNSIAIIGLLIFSSSPFIFKLTIWGIHQRLLFSVLFLVVWILIIKINHDIENRMKYIFLCLTTALLYSTFHKSSLFSVLLFVVFILTRLSIYYSKLFVNRRKINQNVINQFYNFYFITIGLLVITGGFLNKSIEESIFDILFEYAKQMSIDLGLLSVFAVGSIFFFYNRNSTFSTQYILLLLFFVIILHVIIPQPRGQIREPVFFYLYFPLYLIFMTLGMFKIMEIHVKKQFIPLFAILFVISSSILPNFIQVNNLTEPNEIISLDAERVNSDFYGQIKSTGFYVNHYYTETEEVILPLGRETFFNRLSTHFDGKYFTDRSVLYTSYAEYQWNLTYFFMSGRAEGFVPEEDSIFYDINSPSYHDRSLYSPRVTQDFKALNVGLILFSVSSETDEDSPLLFQDINDNNYKVFESELYKIYSFND